MSTRLKKSAVIVCVLTIVLIVVYLEKSESPIEHHQRALAAAEVAQAKANGGLLGITDRIRMWLGRPRDHDSVVAAHQQALIELGALARRDLTLSHDYSRALLATFSPSNMLSVGGEFSYIYYAGDRLTVIAKPDRIERLTRWIHEQDAQIH